MLLPSWRPYTRRCSRVAHVAIAALVGTLAVLPAHSFPRNISLAFETPSESPVWISGTTLSCRLRLEGVAAAVAVDTAAAIAGDAAAADGMGGGAESRSAAVASFQLCVGVLGVRRDCSALLDGASGVAWVGAALHFDVQLRELPTGASNVVVTVADTAITDQTEADAAFDHRSRGRGNRGTATLRVFANQREQRTSLWRTLAALPQVQETRRANAAVSRCEKECAVVSPGHRVFILVSAPWKDASVESRSRAREATLREATRLMAAVEGADQQLEVSAVIPALDGEVSGGEVPVKHAEDTEAAAAALLSLMSQGAASGLRVTVVAAEASAGRWLGVASVIEQVIDHHDIAVLVDASRVPQSADSRWYSRTISSLVTTMRAYRVVVSGPRVSAESADDLDAADFAQAGFFDDQRVDGSVGTWVSALPAMPIVGFAAPTALCLVGLLRATVVAAYDCTRQDQHDASWALLSADLSTSLLLGFAAAPTCGCGRAALVDTGVEAASASQDSPISLGDVIGEAGVCTWNSPSSCWTAAFATVTSCVTSAAAHVLEQHRAARVAEPALIAEFGALSLEAARDPASDRGFDALDAEHKLSTPLPAGALADGEEHLVLLWGSSTPLWASIVDELQDLGLCIRSAQRLQLSADEVALEEQLWRFYGMMPHVERQQIAAKAPRVGIAPVLALLVRSEHPVYSTRPLHGPGAAIVNTVLYDLKARIRTQYNIDAIHATVTGLEGARDTRWFQMTPESRAALDACLRTAEVETIAASGELRPVLFPGSSSAGWENFEQVLRFLGFCTPYAAVGDLTAADCCVRVPTNLVLVVGNMQAALHAIAFQLEESDVGHPVLRVMLPVGASRVAVTLVSSTATSAADLQVADLHVLGALSRRRCGTSQADVEPATNTTPATLVKRWFCVVAAADTEALLSLAEGADKRGL